MGCGNLLSGPNSNHLLETTACRPRDALPIKRSKKQPRSQEAPKAPQNEGVKVRGFWGVTEGPLPPHSGTPRNGAKTLFATQNGANVVQKLVQFAPCFCTIFVQKPKLLDHNLHHVWCKKGGFCTKCLHHCGAPEKIYMHTTPLNQSIA